MAISTSLPNKGFLRIKQIVGNSKATPPQPAIIPVCAATWWAGVKTGRFPAPVKLGPRTTAWRSEDIQALITKLGKEGGNHE